MGATPASDGSPKPGIPVPRDLAAPDPLRALGACFGAERSWVGARPSSHRPPGSLHPRPPDCWPPVRRDRAPRACRRARAHDHRPTTHRAPAPPRRAVAWSTARKVVGRKLTRRGRARQILRSSRPRDRPRSSSRSLRSSVRTTLNDLERTSSRQPRASCARRSGNALIHAHLQGAGECAAW